MDTGQSTGQNTGQGMGLDGVVAAVTNLSQVDGKAGRLIVRGRDIEDLAGSYDFADMAVLLWDGLVPDLPNADVVRRSLGQARLQAAETLPLLLPAAQGLSPIEGLRAGLALFNDRIAIICCCAPPCRYLPPPCGGRATDHAPLRQTPIRVRQRIFWPC